MLALYVSTRYEILDCGQVDPELYVFAFRGMGQLNGQFTCLPNFWLLQECLPPLVNYYSTLVARMLAAKCVLATKDTVLVDCLHPGN